MKVKTRVTLCVVGTVLILAFPAHPQENISNEDVKKLIAIQKIEIDKLNLLSQQQDGSITELGESLGDIAVSLYEEITDLKKRIELIEKTVAQLEKHVAKAQKSADVADKKAVTAQKSADT